MGVVLTLKYLTELSHGRYEYRRRVPISAKATYGKGEFKRVIEARTPAELAKGYAKVEAEFVRMVAVASKGTSQASPQMTPREAAQAVQDAIHAVRGEVLQMLSGVVGTTDEDDRQSVLADDLERRGMSLQYRALVEPKVKLPEPTLDDARKLYLKEKLGDGLDPKHRASVERLDKVIRRAAAGGLHVDRLLSDIDRETAKAVRDAMLKTEKKGGGIISPDSVQRDITVLKSLISHAIRELGLKGKVENHFSELPIPGLNGGSAGVQTATWELVDPLPDEMITAIHSSLPAYLQPIWVMLDGTGCRLAEIIGLRIEDLHMDAEVPFFRVQYHDVRRLKNPASIRSIPLIGDTLHAAQKALSDLPPGAAYLFPRYARLRGPRAASSVLMDYVRKITLDPKHVVHSLRHNVKGRLMQAGVGEQAQDLLLGHASKGVGGRYSGEADRLVVVEKALRAVEALG